MNELRQAAEQALKYFEDAHGLEDTEVAIKEALRQALAEPEPRGYCTCGDPTALGYVHFRTRPCIYYTAPQKREWVGLTDEEKYDVLEGATGDGGRVYYDTLFRSYEAKLKEKNT